MSDEIEVVRGSGNVFADLGREDAEVLQLKALLAADIIKTLDARELTVRKAEELTGIAAADFSRIRQAKLDRFTVERLMAIVRRLGREVAVSVSFSTRSADASHVSP
jgi:predicted XRE-type DNA-binding protein